MLVIGLIVVLIILLVGYLWLRNKTRPDDKQLGQLIPGPKPWPIIGSLHLMANFKKYPFEAFTNLQKVYGSIFQIKLGSALAVVIHSEDDKREVLMTKGDHFDGRPDFKRFDVMFGGDRRNSLAFCDFDKLQDVRRKMMKKHTFPNAGSGNWAKLDQTCKAEMIHLVEAISSQVKDGVAQVDIKDLLVKSSSNIFNSYFCSFSRRSYNDPAHNNYCEAFDKVFWEVNNGRAVDFLPWLLPMMGKEMGEVKQWTRQVRSFVVDELMEERREKRSDEKDRNMMDCFLDQVEEDKLNPEDDDCKINLDIALYALEDILGGHCAVANFATRTLIDICSHQHVQTALIQEVQDTLQGSDFSLAERNSLPLLTAILHESIRLTCPPIVPHVASQDTTIGGHPVAANTVIFINNHYSNFHPELWDQPHKYNPQRFLTEGRFQKPTHFQPYSLGRRSCMGYKMIDNVISSLLATIFSHFELSCTEGLQGQPGGMLALDTKPFYFTVKKIQNSKRRNT